MQAVAVTHDPAFQAKVNEAKGTIGEISVTQLILDREAEKKAKLQIALNPDSPDLDPFVRLIALRSGLEGDQFVSATGRDQEIDHQVWLLKQEFFPPDTIKPSPGLWIWLKRCLLEDTIPIVDTKVVPVAQNPAFQDKLNRTKQTISDIPIPELILEQDQSVSTTGLSDAVEQAWLLIKDFFPLDIYSLPRLGTWSWLLRCLLEDTIPAPKPEDLSLLVGFDPEHILTLGRLESLTQYCSKHGMDLTEFEREYRSTQDRICDLLAQEQRIFIELVPGNNLAQQIGRLRPFINDAHDAGGTDLDAYDIPMSYEDKVVNIFVPRQFQGKTLIEIENSYPISNPSREYNTVAGKTNYDPVAPRPRGPGKHTHTR
ncbi:MAG: hypothetical protein P4L69_13070 [Desulfosporosinus sp.]|nr:hypothetical protein [Desulfosporosinus sp.]